MAFHPPDPIAQLLAVATAIAVVYSGHAAAATAGQGSASNNRGRIVVLGDSLAVSPSPAESFPARLQQKLDDGSPGWTITNAGIHGDTTTGGRRRVTALLGNDVRLLVVALGANDGLRGVPLATVEDNLSAIIAAAQQRGIRVLLCGMETPPIHSWEYTVAFHELFPRLARRYAVPLVPFLLTGVALVQEMNLADGVHPNAAGARLIADNVWPYLEPIVRRLQQA
jgi:acyl-CoA thioesterase I